VEDVGKASFVFMSDIAILKSADSIQRSNLSLLKQANETLLSQEVDVNAR
jgi:hypothetical protein